jgi:HK97 family phage portal protein
MNLTLGNYSLSLSKASILPKPPPDAPVLISMEQPRAPFLFNHYDHPRQNLNFIRETVSACMHARSEAISRGTFHAYGLLAPGRDSIGRFGSHVVHQNAGNVPAGQRPPALPSDHPLERLLQAPNPLFDLSDLLELSSQWLDATGNALWLKVRNGHGEVIELWPVAALSYYIERGADELPATYRFVQSNIRIPAADIIHIRRADIRTAPFLGHAILSDILETAKADTAIRLFQSRFFENDATPRAVLKWPAGAMLTQDQMDQLRLAWESKYGSPLNAGKIGILPDGGEVQLLGSSAKELDFGKSKKDLRDAIREAFKVPQIVVGDVEGVNLANAETSYMVFMRDVVDYTLAKHARAFTRALATEFGEGITIEHESLVPETEERYMARISERKQCITVDEQRALLSLPPLAGGKGKVFLLGNTVVGEDWRAV